MSQGTPRTIGGYVIEGELGRGGMGAVYKARHPMLPGRELALKVLLDAARDEPEMVARFQREMQALAKIPEHANVVRIFTGSAEGSQPFFVMEYVDGPSLAKRVAAAPLAPREAARILLEVARGVAHMHSHGVIHRDLKPQNVFLASDGRVVVNDFGLAKVAGEQRLTRTQSSFGTPGYSAPEQLDGRAARAEKRADIFALGATLWFALVGRPPFTGESAIKVVMATLDHAADPPGRHRQDVPPALDAICLHALEKEPIARYPTADAFAADLDAFLHGKTVAAVEGARAEARSRGRRWVAVLGLALAAGAAFLGFRSWRARELRRERVDGPLAAALAARSDAPALAERLAALEAAGATEDELSRLRRHVLDIAKAEALAPDASTDSVRARTRLLREVGREPAGSGELRAPLARALGRDLERALGAGKAEPATTTELAAAARDVTDRLDLVGENPACGPPVGSLLLDAAPRLESVAAAASAIAAAGELAARRLATAPGDTPGLALRAYAALATAGAMVRPLGPGRPGTPPSRDPAVLSALEAASKLAGEPGERAAWLRLDLLLQDPATKADVALAALEAARQRPLAGAAPQATRGALEELTRLEPTAASLRLLLDPERWKKDPRLAALEASRLLARCGAPSALDRPELVTGGGTLRAEAAREDLAAYTPPRPPVPVVVGPDPRALPQELVGEGYQRADAVREGPHGVEPTDADSDASHDALRACFRKNASAIDEALAAALRAFPEDGGTILAASCQHRQRFSAAPLKILADCTVLDDTPAIEEMFSPRDRGLLLQNKTSSSYYEPAWELEGKHGLAAVDEFRRLVERDTTGGGDPAVTALLEQPASRATVLLAVEAAVGMRALEELTPWDDVPARSDETAELTLRAARGLESYARLGGPGVLAFRARWRRLALPGDAKARLATLDLARMLRSIGETASRADVDSWIYPPLAGAPALAGAFEAAETPGAESLARDLFRLAVAVRYERAVILHRRDGSSPLKERVDGVRRTGLIDTKEKIAFCARAQALKGLLHCEVDMSPELSKVFDLPPDLAARLTAAAYEPRAHWPTGDTLGR